MSTFTQNFLNESIEIIEKLDTSSIDRMVETLSRTKQRGGRLFIAGSGGGAGHASHAACDFRKLAGIESYSVTDNVSELTARVNDESWADAYANWLKVSRISSEDCLMVFSVGGGDEEAQVSVNLVNAIKLAKEVGADIVGVVGRDGGFLGRSSDAVVIIPPVDPGNITTQTEGFQALIWHLVVCHPLLESATPKWESIV